jgi:small multidrug resistance pump
MSLQENSPSPRWHRGVLIIASLQCVVWGVFILAFPTQAATFYGFEKPLTDVFLWKGTGLIIFLFGVGYGLASLDPIRNWSVIVPGFIAKILGPIGMAMSVYEGEVSRRVLILLPVNDIIWWVPFTLILFHAFRHQGTLK